jgi:DnaJ-class molecular chaperone
MEETKELVKAECPKCEGRGRIKVYDHDEHAVSHNFYNEVKCPTCHGMGHIYKENLKEDQ